MKGEKIFRRKYSVDTLTDTATLNFGCVSLWSQSKKDSAIEVDELIVFFPLYYIVQFCKYWFSEIRVSEVKICLNCQETHFNWFFQGHDKLIFCLAVAHASIFDPPRQAFLLENQRLKPFFLSFYKVLTWSKYFYIFLFDSPFTNSLSSLINPDLRLSV